MIYWRGYFQSLQMTLFRLCVAKELQQAVDDLVHWSHKCLLVEGYAVW